MVLKRFKHAYTNYEKERRRYPIKRGGYPNKRGRYPINPFNSATFLCLLLTISFSLRAAAASCRFLYEVWNSPYMRPSLTLPPKCYFNNDSSLLEGLRHWNGKHNKLGLISIPMVPAGAVNSLKNFGTECSIIFVIYVVFFFLIQML